MSSKINLQTCEYARKSSIFQDNQLIYLKSNNTINRISLYFQKTQYIIQYIIFLGYFDIPINIALKLSL